MTRHQSIHGDVLLAKARKQTPERKARSYHLGPDERELGPPAPPPADGVCTSCGKTHWRPDASADVCVGCELDGAA